MANIHIHELLKKNFIAKKTFKEDYLIQSKAIALMYVLLAYILCGILFLTFFSLLSPQLLARPIVLIQILSLIFLSVTGIIFLKNGSFSMASNVCMVNIFLVMVVGLFGKSNPIDCKLFFSNIYYMMSVVILSSLFAQKFKVVSLSVILIICNIVFYIITKKYFPEDFLITAKFAMITGNICIALVTIIAFIISNISDKVIEQVKNEIKKNLQLNFNLKKINEERSFELLKVKDKHQKMSQEIFSADKGLNQMIVNTDDQNKKLNQLINEILSQTKEGVDIIEKMVTSITNIERSNIELNKIMALMNEIVSKTAMINDIVFETKILSFNASIEAARAGAEGAGFSVVAAEVAHLAQMSGETSSSIETILESGQQHISKIIANIKEQVSTAKNIGTHSSKKFSEHTNNVQQLFSQMQNVKDSMISQQTIIKGHLDNMKVHS
ncbi:MAG: hypothetical protein HQK49_09625 [Oligoflexia bacterium]|nr:hypothetical protein [Oligoflexia bacterium]